MKQRFYGSVRVPASQQGGPESGRAACQWRPPRKGEEGRGETLAPSPPADPPKVDSCPIWSRKGYQTFGNCLNYFPSKFEGVWTLNGGSRVVDVDCAPFGTFLTRM